jgi:small subunit ribosomal protein S6
MRTYELTFVVDPRLSDEQTDTLCGEYRQMIESGGGHVEHMDDWGRRKLAYPIRKLEEGRYFLFHISAEGGNPAEEVEHRMRQNEDILRFLTVRTEELDFEADTAAADAEAEEETTTDERAGAEDDGDDENEDDEDEDEEEDS